MIDHIGVQVADVEASLAFYLGVFGPIGVREAMRFPDGDSIVVGLCGPDGWPTFWLSRATAAETRELHLAFRAPEAAQALAHAGREWPQNHPGYYGVFLRDLDGHNVEAVYHGGHDAHGG